MSGLVAGGGLEGGGYKGVDPAEGMAGYAEVGETPDGEGEGITGYEGVSEANTGVGITGYTAEGIGLDAEGTLEGAS